MHGKARRKLISIAAVRCCFVDAEWEKHRLERTELEKEAQDSGNELYLMDETKGTTQLLKFPEIQRRKTRWGEAHLEAV